MEQVGKVCLGTMTWGQQVDEEEAHRHLDFAVKQKGLRFIDSSEIYPVPNNMENHGKAESFIGSWLVQNGREWRDKIVIATKCAGYMKKSFVPLGRQKENDYLAGNYKENGGRSSTRTNKEQILQACDASLARLKTDYIDVYIIHWPDRYVPMFGCTYYDPTKVRNDSVSFSEIVDAMGTLLKDGKIKAWGLSNESAFGVCELCNEAKRQNVDLPVTIQNPFNLLNRSFETTSLAEACAPHHHNLALVAWSPLCGGALTGKYQEQSQAPKDSRFGLFKKFEEQFNKENIQSAISDYSKVANKHNLSLTELALIWTIRRPCVSCIILGASKLHQLEQNLEIIEKGLSMCDTKLEAICKDVDQVYLSQKDPILFL